MNNVNIAKYASPFPSNLFEERLIENNIQFRFEEFSNYDDGPIFSYKIYYVNSQSVSKVQEIKRQLDKEEYENYLKNEYNGKKWAKYLMKFISYLSIILIIYWTIKSILNTYKIKL